MFRSRTEFWARLTSRSKSRWRLKTSRRFVCLSKCFCKAETKKDKGIDAVQLLAQFLFLEGVPIMVNQIRGVWLSPKTFPKLDRLTRVVLFSTWCLDLLDLFFYMFIYVIFMYMIFDILTYINWDWLLVIWPSWKNVRCFTSFFKNPGFSTQGWLHCCSSLHGTLDHRIDGGQCGLHGALHGHRGGRDGHSRETYPALGGWKKIPRVPWGQEDQAWYLLEGSARTAAAEAQSIMEAATQVGEIGQISRHMLTNPVLGGTNSYLYRWNLPWSPP